MPTASRPTRTRRLFWAAAATAAACLLSQGAQAADTPPRPRALLIGIGDYAGLAPEHRLQAPVHDVELLRSALIEAGHPADQITTLTEASPTPPTRNEVLKQLKDIALRAGPGDQITLYISGHGLQAPARHAEREPDGLEELFLMADARADPVTGSVSGAIADFELEAAIGAIMATGADVVFIADTCHGAGVTRSASQNGRVKTLSPTDLGLNMPAPAAARGGTDMAPPLQGDFVGLYAAAPGDLTAERPLPLGEANAPVLSTFTYTLARAIRDGRHRSFRDLQAAMRETAVEAGPISPPLFEGDLKLPFPGLRADRPRLFRVYRLGGAAVMAAGVLEGLRSGDAVELRDASGVHLGETRLTATGPLTSEMAAPAGAVRARPLRPVEPSPLLGRLAPYLGEGRRAPTLGVSVKVATNACGASASLPAWSDLPGPALDMDAVPPLNHCDLLYLRLVNLGSSALDVTAFFVNAAGQALPLTLAPDDHARIGPGVERFAAVLIQTRDDNTGTLLPSGSEALALVWAPAAGRTPVEFAWLADPVPARSAAITNVYALVAPLLTVR